jgi:hypothetical protein
LEFSSVGRNEAITLHRWSSARQYQLGVVSPGVGQHPHVVLTKSELVMKVAVNETARPTDGLQVDDAAQGLPDDTSVPGIVSYTRDMHWQ